jgi:hypothetical protein
MRHEWYRLESYHEPKYYRCRECGLLQRRVKHVYFDMDYIVIEISYGNSWTAKPHRKHYPPCTRGSQTCAD